MPLPTASLYTQDTLRQSSIKVANISGGVEQTYFWMNNHTLLQLRRVPQFAYYHAYRLDIRTGQEEPLEAFNKKYGAQMLATPMNVSFTARDGNHSAPVETVYLPPSSAMSPDGHWLVWRSGVDAWTAVELEGTGEVKWYSAKEEITFSQPVWFSDGSRWAEIVQIYAQGGYTFAEALIRTPFNPTIMSTIPLTHVRGGRVLGIGKDDQIVSFDRKAGEQNDKIVLYYTNLESRTSAEATVTIDLPSMVDASALSLSPDGNEIAWLFTNRDVETQDALFGLWVSDVKGQKFDAVGQLQTVVSVSDSQLAEASPCMPENIRWMPDGKALSFICEDELYKTLYTHEGMTEII